MLLPPELEEVEEGRPALDAAAMACASARAVCIVENAIDTGTPGAWKHPFTKVPTAWRTTLSGRRRREGPRAMISFGRAKRRGSV